MKHKKLFTIMAAGLCSLVMLPYSGNITTQAAKSNYERIRSYDHYMETENLTAVSAKTFPVKEMSFEDLKSSFASGGEYSYQTMSKDTTQVSMSFKLTRPGFVSIYAKTHTGSKAKYGVCNVYLATKNGDDYEIVPQTAAQTSTNITNASTPFLKFNTYLDAGNYFVVFNRAGSNSDYNIDGTVYTNAKVAYVNESSSVKKSVEGSITPVICMESGQEYTGFFSNMTHTKYFEFTLQEDSKVNFAMHRTTPYSELENTSEQSASITCSFLKKSGNSYVNTGISNSSIKCITSPQKFNENLEAGTYIVKVVGYNLKSTNDILLNGKMNISFTTSPFNMTAPKAPKITNYDCGEKNISGTCETIGSKIYIRDNTNKIIGTASVTPNKTWTATLSKPLTAGQTLTPVSANTSGQNNSGSTSLYGKYLYTIGSPVTVKATKNLAAPKFDNYSINTGHSDFTISGTGIKGATVTIEYNSKKYTTKVNANGKWSVKLNNVTISKNTYIMASQKDDSGNYSKTRKQYIVSCPKIGSYSIGGTTISGTGDTNSVITAIYKGVTYTSKVSGKKWSITTKTPITADSTITIYASRELSLGTSNTYIYDTGTSIKATYKILKAPVVKLIYKKKNGKLYVNGTNYYAGGKVYTNINSVIKNTPVSNKKTWDDLQIPATIKKFTLYYKDNKGNTSCTETYNVLNAPTKSSTHTSGTKTVIKGKCSYRNNKYKIYYCTGNGSITDASRYKKSINIDKNGTWTITVSKGTKISMYVKDTSNGNLSPVVTFSI